MAEPEDLILDEDNQPDEGMTNNPSIDSAPPPEGDDEPPAEPEGPDDIDSLILGDQAPPKKPNRIPYTDVRRIVETARKKAREAYEQELHPRLTRAEQLERLGNLLERDPDAALTLLATHVHPRYKELLESAKAAPKAAPTDDDDPMPEPDYPIGNGQKTYSVKGLQAFHEWSARQVEKRIKAEVDSRLNPLVERSTRQEQEAAIQAQLADARANWPGFAEPGMEEAMAKAIRESGGRLPLSDAYRIVVVPKLAEITRKKVLDEINKAPKGTSTTSRAKAPARPSGETLEERMSALYDQLAASEVSG